MGKTLLFTANFNLKNGTHEILKKKNIYDICMSIVFIFLRNNGDWVTVEIFRRGYPKLKKCVK